MRSDRQVGMDVLNELRHGCIIGMDVTQGDWPRIHTLKAGLEPTLSAVVREISSIDCTASDKPPPMQYQESGRRMSRRKAKETFTEADLSTAMKGKTWLDDRGKAFIDEIPGSYKDIDTVIRDSADLVEVKVELNQILNYKGN
jgi:hypothetical protein